MRLTEREHLALAALKEADGQSTVADRNLEREDYLFKAIAFRILARYAKRAAMLSAKAKVSDAGERQQPYGASSGTCAAASMEANPQSLGSSAISTWRRNGRKPERL